MLKKCNSCREDKEISLFVKVKSSKSGYGGKCKLCVNERQKERRHLSGDAETKKYEKTFNGYLMRTYRNMTSRVKGIVKKKAHLYQGLEILDKETFYEWAKADTEYQRLYEEWTASGYEYRLAPSIDRIDSSIGYTIDNIRWLPHWLNSKLGNESRRAKENHREIKE